MREFRSQGSEKKEERKLCFTILLFLLGLSKKSRAGESQTRRSSEVTKCFHQRTQTFPEGERERER